MQAAGHSVETLRRSGRRQNVSPGVPARPNVSAVSTLPRRSPMAAPDTGERVTGVLVCPWRDGRRVNAVRVDYAPDGFTAGAHRHPTGAYVYVIEGSVLFGI